MSTAEAESAAPAARPTIHSIQVMRAIAAIAVVLYHTGIIIALPVYGGHSAFASVAGLGWTGVNFFFVLSGFIIAYAHHQDIGRPERAGRYLWRRFSRIYPFYWICLTGFILAGVMGLGHPDIRWTVGDFASSYLLVAFIPDPALPLHVAWTLLYEIAFYALFLVLILHRGVGIALFVLWTAAILVVGVVLKLDWGQLVHSWNISFLMGILAFWLSRRISPRHGLALLVVGIACFVALAATGMIDSRIAQAQHAPHKLILLGVAFTLILLGGMLFDRHRNWKAPASLLMLGEASCAIYLIHSAAISLVAIVNHRIAPGVLPPELLFIVAALFSIAASVAGHWLVERPVLNATRNGFGQWRVSTTSARAVSAD